MSYTEDRGFCPTCDHSVLGHTQRPSHVLHLLLSLITGGLWIPVWLLLSILPHATRCTSCGSKLH